VQQALQQQAHEAFQQSLSARQGLPTHNTNQGYFGKLLTNKTTLVCCSSFRIILVVAFLWRVV